MKQAIQQYVSSGRIQTEVDDSAATQAEADQRHIDEIMYGEGNEAFYADLREQDARFQRSQLIDGINPTTGTHFTAMEHRDVLVHLTLTPDERRAINYWSSVEHESLQDSIALEVEAAWRDHK